MRKEESHIANHSFEINPYYAIEKPNCTAVIYIQINLKPHYRGITEIYSISVNVTHKEINYLQYFSFTLKGFPIRQWAEGLTQLKQVN